MEIRKKITYQFSAIVALILFVALLLIYFSFSKARKEEFYDRLSSKAKLVGQMLIDIDEINSELLKRIEKNNPLSLPNERIIIFDYSNKIIYSNDNDKLIKISESQIQQVRMNGNIRLTQKPYEILGEFYIGQHDRIVVFASATDIFGFKKLRLLRIIIIIVFFISLAAVYIVGRIFSKKALNPISKIVYQVNKIEISNLNDRLDEGNGMDEIARLAKTFNNMLGRLESAFNTQKNFIANASHELRTPLTVITGQIEVVLMRARENKDYRNILQLVLNEIKDLNLISNKLLLLAQASSDPTEIKFALFRIDDLVWQAQHEILSRNSNYSIQISFDEKIDDEDKLLFNGNEHLIKTAVLNLIENGCKYSNGQLVEIFLEAQENYIKLHFRDKGIGIVDEELELIFQPFYRGKNSLNFSGHGIGLSIVKKIIDIHNGEIQIISKMNMGTEFIIILPK